MAQSDVKTTITMVAATGLILVFGVMALQYKKSRDLWMSLSVHHEERHDYYFNGANYRGYLDICRDAGGEISIRFKDECSS